MRNREVDEFIVYNASALPNLQLRKAHCKWPVPILECWGRRVEVSLRGWVRQNLGMSLFFLYLCDTHGDEMTHDEQLQVDALYQNALRLIEQRDTLQQEIEVQRREIADLKARLSEQCDELKGLESRNRQLLMARALIVSGTDMGIAKERLSQMIKRMDQSIALLELQHSRATTQPH